MNAQQLCRDQRGAAYLEFLVAAPVLLIALFEIFHLGFLFAADLVVERAASAAARAAVVFRGGGHVDVPLAE